MNLPKCDAVSAIFMLPLLQLVVGIFFLIWLWTLLICRWSVPIGHWRERLVRWATISFTAGAGLDFFCWWYHVALQYTQIIALASSGLFLLGAALAVLSKGGGRALAATGSCLLALSWLPFILAIVMYS